ncbi:MAG: Uma2 family endonuclease [Candidatus Methylacidiphilaceae bacterium]
MPTIEQMLSLIDRTDRAHVRAISSSGQDKRIWMLLAVPLSADGEEAPRLLANFVHEFESRTPAEAEKFLKELTDRKEVVCTRKPLDAVPEGDDWWLLQMQNIVYAAVAVPSEEEERQADEKMLEKLAESMQAEIDSRVPETADEYLKRVIDPIIPMGTRLIAGGVEVAPVQGAYYDGGIYMLWRVLEDYIKAKGLPGQVIREQLAVRLGPRDVALPAVCWTEEKVELSTHLGPSLARVVPPFVAECVTTTNAYLLYRPLFCAYERAGVKELWLLDARIDVEPERRTRHYFYQRKGDFLVSTHQDRERIESSVIPGFWMLRSWLSDAPSVHKPALQDILSS